MNYQTTHLVESKFATIPFVGIILPYADEFLYELEERNYSDRLVHKLHLILLQQLSSIAEVTLQEELDSFVTSGQTDYQKFVELVSLLLPVRYPVLEKLLKTITTNYLTHILNIISRFSKDSNRISEIFSLATNENVTIEDIDTNLGDGHSGESTVLVTLSEGTKLIYKPRNIDTTNSYNIFINWINYKLNTDLKTFKCISCGNYGWLEYVNHEPVRLPEELEEYYYKAGILLAVTLLLGSKDCHYENIISSGRNPVLLDHETIIQPVLSTQSIRTWDEEHKIPLFSVLESMLVVNRATGVPLEHTGYGIEGNVETMDLESMVINANTIGGKRVTRFVFRKLVKGNIPFYKDTYVFANKYKNFFVAGFSDMYDQFMYSKEELMSDSSPINIFQHVKIRYVWRPTFVYFKILKYMRRACFMSSFELYKSKLYELMSKAYKNENLELYKLILEGEMKQMLNGDIPLFSLDSSDYHLEEDKSFKIFRLNSIENSRHRIGLLSVDHKKEQLAYITKWLSE